MNPIPIFTNDDGLTEAQWLASAVKQDAVPIMARTAQRARRSGVGEPVVDNPDIDDEQAKRLKEIEEGEMQAHLKYIDKKYTEQGNTYFAETVEEDIPEQQNWWAKFALCLVRHMDRSNTFVQKTSLQVNSQFLKDVLKNVIGTFPGISFQTKDITIDAPYRVLFHYRHELEAAGKDIGPAEHQDHLQVLLGFINEKFKDTIDESDNLKEQGLMSYPHLWTIFRPGDLIYGTVFGQPRAFNLANYQYSCDPQQPGLLLFTEYIDFDGDDFGTRNGQLIVLPFSGAAKINELEAYPMVHHSDQGAIREQLVKRGRHWEQLAGMHFHCYTGIALEHTSCGVARYNIDGRVVVDTKTFHRLNANKAYNVTPLKAEEEKRKKRRKLVNEYDEEEGNVEETSDLIPQDKLDLDPLSDKNCLLASAMTRGFSFTEKRWLEFFVDKLSPPAWNQFCFDQLVLPAAQKDLVQALVANHVQQRSSFDDIVKGKGKGLILVLHGPPGVGKTLTAETVAEFTKRPLYMVSSGDLGTTSEKLDERLTRILDMASTWKCVLLIDEADVFLERRSLHDMERNSLVSIFLRVLEYYEGILFLTSNRVNTFDDAFKSRIHVPLKYNDLTLSSRKKIWKHFLRDEAVDDRGCEALAQAEINGRQIKNVIRTAKSLAQFRNEKLDEAKLQQVVRIQMEFEAELELGNEDQNKAKKKGINGVNGTNGTMMNGH